MLLVVPPVTRSVLLADVLPSALLVWFSVTPVLVVELTPCVAFCCERLPLALPPTAREDELEPDDAPDVESLLEVLFWVCAWAVAAIATTAMELRRVVLKAFMGVSIPDCDGW